MKRVLKFACALVVLVASLNVTATAQKKAKDSKTNFAQEVLQPYVDNGQLAGAISVFYKDGVQETCCIGYADVAAKRPIKLDNVFMQCSQTKGFCGVTIAKLVEEGKISLDDFIGVLADACGRKHPKLVLKKSFIDKAIPLYEKLSNLAKLPPMIKMDF